MKILLVPLYGFLPMYALWIFYLAVMNLKRARDAGLLNLTAKCLGYPILIAGVAVELPGLTKRRHKERELCMEGV